MEGQAPVALDAPGSWESVPNTSLSISSRTVPVAVIHPHPPESESHFGALRQWVGEPDAGAADATGGPLGPIDQG